MTSYRGSCHCGDFVYEVALSAPITSAGVCNCSICSKKGYLFALLSDDDRLAVVKGGLDTLASYTFGSTFDHRFCRRCGCPIAVLHSKPGESAAGAKVDDPFFHCGLNIRSIQGPLDLASLDTTLIDGAAYPGRYDMPDYTGPEPTGGPPGDEPAKCYHGSCHCGAVRYSLRFKPLETLGPNVFADRVVDCNCSVCLRFGFIWIYPQADQVAIQGAENLSSYIFARHVSAKKFCRICGVGLFNPPLSYPPEEEAHLPALARSPESRDIRERTVGRMPVNLRTLHGIDLAKLPVQTLDGYGTMTPSYVNP